MATAEFRCLTISASDGTAEMNERGAYNYVYRVAVKSDATNRRIVFKFHASQHDYNQGKRGLGANELLEAFWSFVSDVEAGEMDWNEFSSTYGYDDDSYNARRTWQACKQSGRKFRSLWTSLVEPADVLEELAGMGLE